MRSRRRGWVFVALLVCGWAAWQLTGVVRDAFVLPAAPLWRSPRRSPARTGRALSARAQGHPANEQPAKVQLAKPWALEHPYDDEVLLLVAKQLISAAADTMMSTAYKVWIRLLPQGVQALSASGPSGLYMFLNGMLSKLVTSEGFTDLEEGLVHAERQASVQLLLAMLCGSLLALPCVFSPEAMLRPWLGEKAGVLAPACTFLSFRALSFPLVLGSAVTTSVLKNVYKDDDTLQKLKSAGMLINALLDPPLIMWHGVKGAALAGTLTALVLFLAGLVAVRAKGFRLGLRFPRSLQLSRASALLFSSVPLAMQLSGLRTAQFDAVASKANGIAKRLNSTVASLFAEVGRAGQKLVSRDMAAGRAEEAKGGMARVLALSTGASTALALLAGRHLGTYASALTDDAEVKEAVLALQKPLMAVVALGSMTTVCEALLLALKGNGPWEQGTSLASAVSFLGLLWAYPPSVGNLWSGYVLLAGMRLTFALRRLFQYQRQAD